MGRANPETWQVALSGGMSKPLCEEWTLALIRELLEVGPRGPRVIVGGVTTSTRSVVPMSAAARKACPACGAPWLVVVHIASGYDAGADPCTLAEAPVLCVAEPHLVEIASDPMRYGF